MNGLEVKDNKFNTVEEAIEDIQKGKLVIVVDDENRENEGDFIGAANMVTPEMVNFMARYGRGLICCPLSEEISNKLDLELMVGKNTVLHQTQFTVSIDLKGDGCTTGISVSDRAKTILALTKKESKANDFGRPGHIFPLIAKNGGVLRRAGHTEAAVDLATLAGFEPVGVLVEILNDDGSMARLPQLLEIAKKHNLKIISIEDLIKYRLKYESSIEFQVKVKLPTKFGEFDLYAFTQLNNNEIHLALKMGEWTKEDVVLVRVHSSCVTGDILHSLRCDCGDQLDNSMKMISEKGTGLILYMQQEGRGIGLINKLKAYELQENGFDTVNANIELGFKPDNRDYGIGAQILKYLDITKINLISNNPKKRQALNAYGISIVEETPIVIESNKHNHDYLKTKKSKLGHKL